MVMVGGWLEGKKGRGGHSGYESTVTGWGLSPQEAISRLLGPLKCSLNSEQPHLEGSPFWNIDHSLDEAEDEHQAPLAPAYNPLLKSCVSLCQVPIGHRILARFSFKRGRESCVRRRCRPSVSSIFFHHTKKI